MLDIDVIFRVAFMRKRLPTDVAPMFGALLSGTHMRLDDIFLAKPYVAAGTLADLPVRFVESKNIVIL